MASSRWQTSNFAGKHTVAHNDVIELKHFPRYWPFARRIHRSPVNSPHKGQWRGTLMSSLICTWINGWVNNREAGDLRRHRAHYDVTVMWYNQHGSMRGMKYAGCTSLNACLWYKSIDQQATQRRHINDLWMSVMYNEGRDLISGLWHSKSPGKGIMDVGMVPVLSYFRTGIKSMDK